MSKPRLLDLFCGAGGCAKGYQRAGFYVVGVDNRPQPRYCGDEFVQADAFDVLARWRVGRFAKGVELATVDAIHASPLWWRWTQQARQNGTENNHPDDVAPTLRLLEATRLPFVLEIGSTSPQPAVTICGVSCGLRVTRHMRFVTNWPLMVPPCSHKHGGCADGLYVPYRGSYHKEPNWRNSLHRRADWREAAGVEWMSTAEAELSIPPAYTELIGHQLVQHLAARSAA